MNIRAILTLMLAAGLLAGIPVMHTLAQGRQAGPRLERMAKELDLTQAQREKMRAASENQMRRGIQERADMQIARLDLQKLVRADKPDPKAIDAQIDRLAGMRAQLAKERMATMLEMRSMLTDEQRAKLKELRATRPIRGRAGRGRSSAMPDGGGPPSD